MPVKAAISRNQLLETRGERHSSYTVVRKIISGGSALTLSYARHANKPVLHIHNSETGHDPLSHQVRRLKDFIESKRDRTLECSRSAREQRTRCLPLHTATTPAVLAAISSVAFSLAFPPAVIFSVPEIIISLACAETAFRHNS